MGVIGIPCVELVRDSLGTHDAVEVLILAEALVVPAGGEDVGVAAVVVKEPGISEIGQIVSGQVEVAILVVVAAQEVGESKAPDMVSRPVKMSGWRRAMFVA